MNQDFSWLKNTTFIMGEKTVDAVDLAMRAMTSKDATAAAAARKIENQVDFLCYEINEHCMGSLAATTCSRSKVNFVVGSMKIARELERICDYANQIAQMVQNKFSQQDMELLSPLHEPAIKMKDESLEMLWAAMKCYEGLDCNLTHQIIDRDTLVDKRNRDLFRDMLCIVSVHPWVQETIMDYYVAIRYIERVADRATNIAKLVYYIVLGEMFPKGKPIEGCE